MAESRSVRAVLSAVDKGFTSTIRSAQSAVQSLGERIKSGFAFGVITRAGEKAFDALATGARDLIGELNSSANAWATFEGNLPMLGKSADEIAAAKKELQKFAQDTVYNSSDMATTFSQLAAVGVENTEKLVKGFGGLAAAAENPQQAMKTLSTQATQMAAKPKVAWEDFKLMLEQSPAGIAAVARAMGKTTAELVADVQDGNVATKDFLATIAEVGTNEEFTKLATKAKTMGQALDGAKEMIANKLMPAFHVLSEAGISAIDSIAAKLDGIDAQGLADKLSGALDKVLQYWRALRDSFSGVGAALSGAFGALGGALLDVTKSITGITNQADALDAFRAICEKVAGAIKAVAGFVQKNAKAIAQLAPAALGAVGAFKAFGFLRTFNPFALFKANADSALDGVTKSAGKNKSFIANLLKSLGGALKNIFSGLGTAAAGLGKGLGDAFTGLGKTLTGLGKTLTGLGKGASTAFQGLGKALKVAKPTNILALGVAIGIVVSALALLASQGGGVASILRGIGDAIGSVVAAVITALSGALLTLAPVLPVIAKALAELSPLITALGAAFATVAAAIGEAVAVIAEGIAPIVEIIAGAVTEIGAILSDMIVGIVQAIAPFLPAITQMVTQITSVIANAIVSVVQAMAPYFPEIQKMVTATVQGIEAICGAFTALVQQIAPIIESVANVIKALGDTIANIFQGIGDLIAGVGEAIGAVIEGIGSAIADVIEAISGGFEKVLNGIASLIDSIGNAARNAGEGFKSVAEGIRIISELSLWDVGKALSTVATGMSQMAKHGSGLTKAASGLQEIVEATQRGGASAGQMGAQFDSAGNQVTGAARKMKTAFQNVADTATQAGKKAGSGFSQGLQSGLNNAPRAASAAISKTTAALRAGYGNIYRAGAYISQGFAQGMLSQLAAIQRAAAQMASAADAALRAKARIASPSKVAAQEGRYWGEGLAIGIASMEAKVRKAAESLFLIPNVNTPRLAMAYSGEMSADYDYYQDSSYTIEVPVRVDGREVAKATATYTQEEIERQQARDNRKRGNV